MINHYGLLSLFKSDMKYPGLMVTPRLIMVIMVHANVRSQCNTPETDIILHITYISITRERKGGREGTYMITIPSYHDVSHFSDTCYLARYLCSIQMALASSLAVMV